MPIFRVINPTDRHGFVDVLRDQRLARQILDPHVTVVITADEAKAYSQYVTVEEVSSEATVTQ